MSEYHETLRRAVERVRRELGPPPPLNIEVYEVDVHALARLARRVLPFVAPSWADQRRLARLHRTQNRKPRGLRKHLRREKAARG